MSLFLKAAAKCDEEGCTFEEEMYIKLDLAAGPSMFMIADLPPPPNWETWVALGYKRLRCPGCCLKRKKSRLKVVGDDKEES